MIARSADREPLATPFPPRALAGTSLRRAPAFIRRVPRRRGPPVSHVAYAAYAGSDFISVARLYIPFRAHTGAPRR